MKKLLLLTVICLMSIISISAQNFGVKAGLNFASISGDDAEDFDGRTSFHIGAYTEFEISESFSFQPELLYSSQGAKSSFSEDGFDVDMDIKLNYLNIPLMAKYYFSDGFNFEFGPQIGFLLSAEAEVSFAGVSETEDIKDDLKGTDFGLNFGLGYKLESGLNFGLRYNLGLSKLDDSDEMEESDIKNGVFQISLGYSF